MHHDYDLLIVGGGMAADAAAKGYRDQGGTGTIGVVGAEPDAPYARPPLSKDLWSDPDPDPADAALGTDGDDGPDVTLHLGDAAATLDVEAKQVVTEGGDTFGYGSLVLAPGATPRTLDALPAGERVVYHRTLADYRRLADLVSSGTRAVVVGSGFIGTEMAAGLSRRGAEVTLVHPGQEVGDHAFPPFVTHALATELRKHGVTVVDGVQVTGGTVAGDGVSVELSDGESLQADVVVLGLGVEPAVGWLAGAVDLADDGGIRVDERLATSVPDVYAVGDAASYPDKRLGRRRVEHEDAAVSMGKAAGRIVAGSDEEFDKTPMFYSDVFDLGYEAVGDLSTELDHHVQELDDGQAYVFYADDRTVRGVLLWAFAPGLDAATELVGTARPQDLAELEGRVA